MQLTHHRKHPPRPPFTSLTHWRQRVIARLFGTCAGEGKSVMRESVWHLRVAGQHSVSVSAPSRLQANINNWMASDEFTGPRCTLDENMGGSEENKLERQAETPHAEALRWAEGKVAPPDERRPPGCGLACKHSVHSFPCAGGKQTERQLAHDCVGAVQGLQPTAFKGNLAILPWPRFRRHHHQRLANKPQGQGRQAQEQLRVRAIHAWLWLGVLVLECIADTVCGLPAAVVPLLDGEEVDGMGLTG